MHEEYEERFENLHDDPEKDFVDLRDYLITVVLLQSAQCPGAVSNLTASEFHYGENTSVKRLRMRELSGEEVEEHQLMIISTSLPMVVDCSDTSLVGILHNFHCEHCCLLCFLAIVLHCDSNSCKDI